MKMGRAIKRAAIFSLLLMLGGCAAPEQFEDFFTEEESPSSQKGHAEEEISENGYEITEGADVEDGTGEPAQDTGAVVVLCESINGLTQEELDAWNRIGMNDLSVEKLREEQKGLYYYDRLEESQQLLYAEILMILSQSEENITVSETDGDRLDLVFQAVLADHPEIFYVSGYSYTQYLLDSSVQRIRFTGTYTMTPEQIAAKQPEIDRYVAECLSGMPDGDDYVRLRYLYEYLIGHTDYILNAPENQSICSVFLYGQSVCQGYAKAYQYLCREAGVVATLVTGSIKETGYGHAWNLVVADGDYYYVDITWGDASYTSGADTVTANVPGINYEYLCITTDQIEQTHEIDTIVSMPYCTAITDNFYVREQAYFTVFDTEALSALFAQADPARQNYVTFRCASSDIYDQYRDYLITQQKIFLYMNSDRGISYSENPVAQTLSFWLP